MEACKREYRRTGFCSRADGVLLPKRRCTRRSESLVEAARRDQQWLVVELLEARGLKWDGGLREAAIEADDRSAYQWLRSHDCAHSLLEFDTLIKKGWHAEARVHFAWELTLTEEFARYSHYVAGTVCSWGTPSFINWFAHTACGAWLDEVDPVLLVPHGDLGLLRRQEARGCALTLDCLERALEYGHVELARYIDDRLKVCPETPLLWDREQIACALASNDAGVLALLDRRTDGLLLFAPIVWGAKPIGQLAIRQIVHRNALRSVAWLYERREAVGDWPWVRGELLSEAISTGKPELANLLIEKGATINDLHQREEIWPTYVATADVATYAVMERLGVSMHHRAGSPYTLALLSHRDSADHLEWLHARGRLWLDTTVLQQRYHWLSPAVMRWLQAHPQYNCLMSDPEVHVERLTHLLQIQNLERAVVLRRVHRALAVPSQFYRDNTRLYYGDYTARRWLQQHDRAEWPLPIARWLDLVTAAACKAAQGIDDVMYSVLAFLCV